MYSVRRVIKPEERGLKEKALAQSEKQINSIFADIIISFVTQIFSIRKQDAFIDTQLTTKLLEVKLDKEQMTSDTRKSLKHELKKRPGVFKNYCLNLDVAKSKFINESKKIKETGGKDVIEKLVKLAENIFNSTGELRIDKMMGESKMSFNEGIICLNSTYEFVRDGLVATISEAKTVRSRISDIMIGQGENFIEAKRSHIFIGLEIVLNYMNNTGNKKDIKIEELIKELSTSKELIKELSSKSSDSEVALRGSQKTIESLGQQVQNKVLALTQSNNEVIRVKKENEELQSKNEELERELAELRALKIKIESGNLCNSDGDFWEEMYSDLELQFEELVSQKDAMHSKSLTDNRRIIHLERLLEDIYTNHLDRATACKVRCEQGDTGCSVDDMLGFVTYGNCSVGIKQDCAEEVMNFLDFFIDNTSKGASSGMNIQSASHKGKGNGKFANNFINSIINYFKDIYRKKGTQVFLESITNIEWKKVLEDYSGGSINVQSSKKQIIISDVYNNLRPEDLTNKSLFEAFNTLPIILKRIDKGDTDLTTLSNNIKEAMEASILSKKLTQLLKGTINIKSI